jgi:hypothetical protein
VTKLPLTLENGSDIEVGSSTLVLESDEWDIRYKDNKITNSASINTDWVERLVFKYFVERSLTSILFVPQSKQCNISFDTEGLATESVSICVQGEADEDICTITFPDGRIIACNAEKGFVSDDSRSEVHAIAYSSKSESEQNTLEPQGTPTVDPPLPPERRAEATGKKSGRERYYFEKFRLQAALPHGEITYGDKPDVIIAGDRTLGIEITNFYLEDGKNPASEQLQRRLRPDVLATAERVYKAECGGIVGVTLGFNIAVPIKTSRKEKAALARRIAEAVSALSKTETGQVYRYEYQNVVPELGFLYIHTGPYDDGKWRLQQSYDVRLMSRDHLAEIIKDKTNKAKDYKPCDAYWLLIVVEFIDPAQDQEIRLDNLGSIDCGVFEKVLVYKTAFEHVIELGGPSS